MKAVSVFPETQTLNIFGHEAPRIIFIQRWPDAVRSLIAGRYPPEQAFELILGRPTGIKSVISFGEARI